MFKKKDNDPGQETPVEETEEAKAEEKKPQRNTLPLVIELEYPYEYAKKRVTQLVCDQRPSMGVIKRVMACGDDDVEMMEVVFENILDIPPPELEYIDAKDGLKAFKKVFDFFPHLKGE